MEQNNKNMETKEINKKESKNIVFNIIAIISIIMFAISIVPVSLQNDTFYTIEIGNYIFENGITGVDPFSWHDNLPYTFPHWLYDCMMAGIYNITGFFGIYMSTILFTIILGISFFIINIKLNKNKLVAFIATLFMLYLMQSYITARAQLVTFILFLIEVFLIERFLDLGKKRYAVGLVIIALLLANLHVAVFPFFFILFMPYFGEWVISYLPNLADAIQLSNIKSLNKKLNKLKDENQIEKLKNKIQSLTEKLEKNKLKRQKIKEKPYKIIVEKNNRIKWLLVIMIICILMGLITPLGDTPYTYLIKTMQGNTTDNINEHLPMALIYSKQHLCFIAVFIILLMFTDTKIRLKDLFMISGLLLLALMSRRQLSFVSLIGMLIFARLVSQFFEKYDKNGSKEFIAFLEKPFGIILTIVMIFALSFYFIKPKLDDTFIETNSYPVSLCDYIDENLDKEKIKIYNEYNYGSYLIFRKIPVYIDSRADLYAPEFNNDKDIFMEFMKLSGTSIDYEEVFNEYGITHIIVYKDNNLDKLISRDGTYINIYEDDNFRLYERFDYKVEHEEINN